MRTRSWRELVVGSLALGGCVVALGAVLIFARVGALHGETIRLYTATSEARGIMRGTDVVLGGVRIGRVADIHFRSATVDTSSRVIVAFDIMAAARDNLRRDSYAQIRTNGSLIGNPVVYLTAGSPRAAVLAPGDTVRAKIQGDLEGVTSRFARGARDFPAIIGNVKTLNAELGAVQGALGALGAETPDSRGTPLAAMRYRLSQFTRATFSGNGTVGLILRDTALAARAETVMQEAQTLLRVAGSGGPLARARRDTAFLRSLQSAQDEVTLVRRLLDEPRGTAGRVIHDRAVSDELARLERQLGDLIADAKRHPFRYAGF
ncbi:MAG: hypothetical protein NVS4B3_04120 [Gemmatimonadaceae bacterium]